MAIGVIGELGRSAMQRALSGVDKSGIAYVTTLLPRTAAESAMGSILKAKIVHLTRFVQVCLLKLKRNVSRRTNLELLLENNISSILQTAIITDNSQLLTK